MHNNIMAAGDTLRKCILDGPYQPTIVIILVVPTTENSPEVPERTAVETGLTMLPENKDHYESEKEAIHLLLTGIGDDIYSTVDACKTAHEMREAIKRLQQEWSRFVTIVKQQHKLDEVSYHKLFDILKQYQKEVNEFRAERMAKNANLLALVATAQTHQEPYYQTSKSHKSYTPTSKASLLTKTHATTRHKGKEIAKPITPPSESAYEEDSDLEQAQKDKDMQKNLALIAKYFKKLYKPTNNNLRTSSNTSNKNVDTTQRYKNNNQTGQFGNQRAVNVAGARDIVGGQVVPQSGIQCFNYKEFGNFAKEYIKPKRVKDSTYHKEKMLLCKQAKKGVQLQAEQSDWLVEMDEEIDEQELEAHYIYMEKIQEVPNADSGTDSKPLEQNDQNAVECDDGRVVLANLIANLKIDIDENKKIQKQLKKANASLTQELSECKSILAETSRTLEESNIDYDETLKRTLKKLQELITQKDIDIKEGLKLKAYEISVVQEKHDELVKQSLLTKSHYEDAHTELQCLNLHKVKESECLAQKLSKQTESVSKEVYTELLRSFAKLEKHLNSLELALQQCQEQLKNDTVCKEKASNVFLKEREQYFEIQDLKAKLQEKNIVISELKKIIEKCKGKSMETKFDKPSVVQQPNAQRIPKPSVLGKPAPFSDSLERKNFAKKRSVLKTNESEGLSKPVTTQNLPQTAREAVSNTNVIKPGMYRIDTRTTQTRAPQLPQTSMNTNPRMSTSTEVNHRTNVSRPQLRSTQMKDKVVPNTSQVKFKKTEVEDHHRISSNSNQTKSVTAFNDSLKSRTLIVNAVCATCGKCVFNSNHDACVYKYLNDVNSRTKKPKVVPISTRKPKSQANNSGATYRKKTVASETTVHNSKSYYRMLYEKTSKAWKWWIEQQCPSPPLYTSLS
ncbi:hypothetical protein Tco_1243785 [Tanacetum coccineum]